MAVGAHEEERALAKLGGAGRSRGLGEGARVVAIVDDDVAFILLKQGMETGDGGADDI